MSFLKKLLVLTTTLVLAVSTSATAATGINDYDVKIVKGSNINLVAQSSRVPVLIQNNYNTEVRLLINVSTSNLRVRLPRTTAVTVPANSTVNATVPVQAIANGEVTLNIWLTSFSGVRIGNDENIQMTVIGNVEAIALGSLGALVGVLLILGTIRMVRRKRIGA